LSVTFCSRKMCLDEATCTMEVGDNIVTSVYALALCLGPHEWSILSHKLTKSFLSQDDM